MKINNIKNIQRNRTAIENIQTDRTMVTLLPTFLS